ncbi:unnamed protein product [Macrosiphum euphorbiae]|uniref:RdRp catalytic domain-containing protein n=1 Tax=Macrosiphum euphorbiae TaxID=13131 RepID=A0AAV0WHK4_9HEMI|nr:unnamed protein product [Macrosiphum euphorbiae]
MQESDYSWRGHIGGIEELRQNGWTIFTVTIHKLIAEEFDINCQLMGQGDNQVLICKYPKNSSHTRQIHEEFIDSLELILKKIGPPLKARETWMSSVFFIYGKNPIYKGNRPTNEQFQNLESTPSSIAANTSSASIMN